MVDLGKKKLNHCKKGRGCVICSQLCLKLDLLNILQNNPSEPFLKFSSPGRPLFTWVSRGDGGGWARKGLG